LTDPGTVNANVTVALLDSKGNQVPNLNSGGNPSGGNVAATFASQPTVNKASLMTIYVMRPYEISGPPPIQQYAASALLTFGVTTPGKPYPSFPALSVPGPTFWTLAMVGNGLNGYNLGSFSDNGASVTPFSQFEMFVRSGGTVVSGVYMSPNITSYPFGLGGNDLITSQNTGIYFDFNVGVYGAYFSTTAPLSQIYDAISAFVPTVGF
jgi:hypothetical protein